MTRQQGSYQKKMSIVGALARMGVHLSDEVQLVWLLEDETFALKVPEGKCKLLGLRNVRDVEAFRETILEMVKAQVN